jgi:hypothetical protein
MCVAIMPYNLSAQKGTSMRIAIAMISCFALQGCVTSIVKDVVTAPIKIVSKTADVLTTSQSEIDQKRGRDIRKKEEELGKISRKLDKARDKCDDGSDDACDEAKALESQYEELKYPG